MILKLSEIDFSYDFFSTSMPDGSLLVLNNVNEDFTTEGTEEMIVKKVNILVQPVDSAEAVLCSSVIGIGNKYLKLDSEYPEQLGKILTQDNLKYCTLELFENE